MSEQNKLSEYYEARIAELRILIRKLSTEKNRISWGRLGAAVAIIAAAYFLWPYAVVFLVAGIILFVALFLFLVVMDSRKNAELENANRLLDINREEIKINQHDFIHRDDGMDFLPADHDYAGDMDIFGRASLYQYINRTTSEQGNKVLSDWLLNPADQQHILLRQQAVQELTEQVSWRQQLQSYGTSDQIKLETSERIMNWINEEDRVFRNIAWKYLRFILPAIILTLLLFHIAGIVGASVFYSCAFIFLLFSGYTSKLSKPLYEILNKIAGQIETLSKTAEWIEKTVFKSPMLQGLQKGFLSGTNKASKDIIFLKKILDRFDLRLNPLVFIPLNTFLLWDLQQVFALEKWKDEHREKISAWFASIGELEAISSIANLSFNNPTWRYPVMSDVQGTLIGVDLGHPLIERGKLVRNSFSPVGTNRLSLVTGSNMAGKSTFLRTIGINILLAMMGSPVFATSFTIYPVRLMSSMRVNDNLEESTSTFYAELKKLKNIIDAVNQGMEIFILLDEILRGTNSFDRHIGSKALIKQLIRHKASGIIATHDLELAKLAEEYPKNIINYHFDVQLSGEELFFDYKLKEGVCQSLNASILMRKMGIEL